MVSKERIQGHPDVSEDQLLEVLRSLDESPIKVSLQQEYGSWSPWMDRAIRDERRRTTLREAEARYRQEYLGIEEREELWSRIIRLRRKLGVA